MAGWLASSPTHSSFLLAGGGVLPVYSKNKIKTFKLKKYFDGGRGDGELAMEFFFIFYSCLFLFFR